MVGRMSVDSETSRITDTQSESGDQTQITSTSRSLTKAELNAILEARWANSKRPSRSDIEAVSRANFGTSFGLMDYIERMP